MYLLLQAYGAQEYEVVGLVTQRAMVVCSCVSLLTIAVWSQLHHILAFIGADGLYATLILPAVNVSMSSCSTPNPEILVYVITIG
jgi:hypothetical protein